jgi:Uncharacterized conserved protein (DUF2249)
MTIDAESRTAKCWQEGDGVHIDVRGLPPPQPLVAILRLVHEQGEPGSAVIVHHDRDPLLLYPELAEIGWVAQRIEAPSGEVRLRLWDPRSRADPLPSEPTEPAA